MTASGTCSWVAGSGFLCRCQVRRKLIPRTDQPRCPRGTGITQRKTQPIEPFVEIPDEGMACTHDLGTRHGLTAPHAPNPSFEMLVISLTVLLFHLAHAMVDCYCEG